MDTIDSFARNVGGTYTVGLSYGWLVGGAAMKIEVHEADGIVEENSLRRPHVEEDGCDGYQERKFAT